MHRRQSGTYSLVTLLSVAFSSCGGSASTSAERETLSDGRVVVRYAALPSSPRDTIDPDLVIGKLEGAEWKTFGNIRAVAAAEDGSIYILDYQASSIRVFDRNGSYLRTLARSGKGPGEITEANGIALAPDGSLWVQDYGTWSLLVLSPEGVELRRHPMPRRSHGYDWSGTLDAAGVLWQPVSHAASSRRVPEVAGVHETHGLRFMQSFNPAGEVLDSVYLGEWRSHSVRVDHGNEGYSISGIPFAPRPLAAISRARDIWTASTAEYQVVRHDTAGDTTLVLNVGVELEPLTAEELAGIKKLLDRAGSGTGSGPDIPSHKPVLQRLLVDDAQRLWVQRPGTIPGPVTFDVFTRDAEYLGSATIRGRYMLYPAVHVRTNHIYGVVTDTFDVSYVARARLPDWLREQ